MKAPRKADLIQALQSCERVVAEKVRVGRCMHDRCDWEMLLQEIHEALGRTEAERERALTIYR